MASGRDWPLENFLALARLQVERGRTPVIVLGPGERVWQDVVRRELPTARVPDLDAGDGGPGAVGGPTLTVALGGRVAAAVANDAGAGHLLAVGGAPMVSLFGPSRPAKRAPFARALIVVKAQDYGSDQMAAIPVDAVVAAVDRQVAVGPARRV
jgi:ADP-heptose:LPS heptosyltransferase